MTISNPTYQARVDAALSIIDDLMQLATDADRKYLAADLDAAYKAVDFARRRLPAPHPFAIGDRVRFKSGQVAYIVMSVKPDGSVAMRSTNALNRVTTPLVTSDRLDRLEILPPHQQLNLTTGGARK